jgi:tetratricopeptide (TPR) repeat protein
VLDPTSAEAYNTRGRAWHCKSDYDKAIADCSHALALDPRLAEAYAYRGDVRAEKGEYDKALADCNQALAINPKAGRKNNLYNF